MIGTDLLFSLALVRPVRLFIYLFIFLADVLNNRAVIFGRNAILDISFIIYDILYGEGRNFSISISATTTS